MKYFFSFKVEPQGFSFADANFLVSLPINIAAIENDVIKRLKELNLKADKSSFNYVVRENQLYLEGWACEDKPRQSSGIMLISRG